VSILTDAEPMTFVLTADRAKSRPFYEDVLGLPVVGEDDFAVTFRLANGTPLRLTSLPGHVPSDHTVLGWTVSDIAAAVAELKRKGVAMNIYEGFGQDEDGIWHAPDRSAKLVWFNDPEGNVLSVKQG